MSPGSSNTISPGTKYTESITASLLSLITLAYTLTKLDSDSAVVFALFSSTTPMIKSTITMKRIANASTISPTITEAIIATNNNRVIGSINSLKAIFSMESFFFLGI